MKSIDKRVFFLLCLLIVSLFFGFIYRYSFRMLFWDQWGIVEPVVVQKIDLNMWQYQHNEHRIGTGLIVIKILAAISHWNNLVETIFEGLMFVVIAALCFEHFGFWSSKKHDWFDLSVPLIIFNLNQWGNLTWGFQIIFVLPVLFLFLNLWLLGRRKNWTVDLIILVIGLLASRSAFHGIFVPCISVGYYLALIIKGRKVRFGFVLWSLLNVLIIGSYFIGLQTFGVGNKLDLLFMVKYGVSLINNFVGYRHLDWLGLLLPGYLGWLFVKYMVKDWKRLDVFVVGMIGFSVLFMLATSWGRSNLGIGQAFSSRYNTTIFPLFLAGYWAVKRIGSRPNKWLFFAVILAAFFQGIYMARYELYIYAFKKGTDAWANCYREKHDAYVCEKEIGGFKIYPDLSKGGIVEKLSILKSNKMNLY